VKTYQFLARSRAVSTLAAVAVAACGLMLVASGSAGADTRPQPGIPATVSADALPTVQIDGVIWSQVTIGDIVYAGGQFTEARPAGAAAGTDQTARNNLLAYNITTGTLVTSFVPNLNAAVHVVTASPDGKTLYVGGDFTTANGQPHQRIAAYNTTTGALINTFNPQANDRVDAIAATNTSVYFGGNFTTVNGLARTRLAATAPAGALQPWSPAASDEVDALLMAPDGSKVIIAGKFATISGTTADGLGAVDPASGVPVSGWATQSGTYPIQDDASGSGITSLSTDGTLVYATGFSYGAGNFEGRWAFSPANGSIIWLDDCHGDSYSTYPMGGALYSAGHAHDCSAIGGFPNTTPMTNERAIAESTTPSGGTNTGPDSYGWNYNGIPDANLLDWYPTFVAGTFTGQDQAAWSVTGNGQYVSYGGEFPTVNSTAQQGLVRFAVSALAPDKMGPHPSAGLTPTVTSTAAGTAVVSFKATWDQDNTNLTYKVVRNSKTATPVYTTTVASTFWNEPAISFTDTGLAPGAAYSYRIYVTDPFGNANSGSSVVVTVAAPPATTTPAATA
jgi:hypothetical protein